MAARLLPLQPFTFSLGFSIALSTLSHFALQNHASFIGKYDELLQHICQHGGDNKALKHATNCGTNVASTKPQLVVGYYHKMTIS